MNSKSNHREYMLNLMLEFRMPNKWIDEFKNVVNTNEMRPAVFTVNRKLKQYDSISCTLFNNTLESVMKTSIYNQRGASLIAEDVTFGDDSLVLTAPPMLGTKFESVVAQIIKSNDDHSRDQIER